MKVDAIKGVVTIPIKDLEFVQYSLLRALADMRLIAGKPLTPYENDNGPLTDFDFGSIAIVEAGLKVGLDLGICNGHNHNQLNLTKYK